MLAARIALAGLLLIGAVTLCLSIDADKHRHDRKRNILLVSALCASSAAGLILILTGESF